jgi:hypothetical protein
LIDLSRAQVIRDHSFRVITARRYYLGPHAIEMQVDGVVAGRSEFELLPEGEPADTGSRT